ncbi:MAG: hypothetical protein ACI4K9_03440 [Candidatus Fimenecus sp.]
MKPVRENKSCTRRIRNADTLLWLLCILLLVLSAFSFWNAFRLYRTANELLRSATAVTPTIVWYEEVETQEASETQIPTYSAVTTAVQTANETVGNGQTFVLNTSSKKIHSPTCRYAESMQETNKQVVTDKTLEELLNEGYSVCAVCNAE